MQEKSHTKTENSTTPVTICMPYSYFTTHMHQYSCFPPRSPQHISPVGPHDWLHAQLHTLFPNLSLFCPSFCTAPSHLFFNHQKRCSLFSSATLSASHLSISCTDVHMCISPFMGSALNEITVGITMMTGGQTFHTQFHLKHQRNKKGQTGAVHKVLQWRKWFSMELAMQVISIHGIWTAANVLLFTPFICLFVFRLH